MTPMTKEDFETQMGVSRETSDKLQVYLDLLTKWQKAINLVSKHTLADPWRRHMLDSAQIAALAPAADSFSDSPGYTRTWVDLGSGGGFPALVLAILGVGEVHLVESDSRKCAFLREVKRATGANAVIHNTRCETITSLKADIVTARAFAPLEKLLSLSKPFCNPNTVCLFLKGQNVDLELDEAHKSWHITPERLPSLSDPQGVILKIEGLTNG